MIIKFNEQFNLNADEVYSRFCTPPDWAQLFGFPGDSKDLGDGWYSVSIKNFPFPLEVKNTKEEPHRLVSWVFRGFWRGRGEVRFEETAQGVTISGFEEISVRPLFFFSPIIENLVLERGFKAIWGVGWHRLRKLEMAQNKN